MFTYIVYPELADIGTGVEFLMHPRWMQLRRTSAPAPTTVANVAIVLRSHSYLETQQKHYYNKHN